MIILAGTAGLIVAFAAAALGILVGRPAKPLVIKQPDAQATARAMTFTTPKSDTP